MELQAAGGGATKPQRPLGVVVLPERQGINPATKETITIPAKKVVKFKAGADLAL